MLKKSHGFQIVPTGRTGKFCLLLKSPAFVSLLPRQSLPISCVFFQRCVANKECVEERCLHLSEAALILSLEMPVTKYFYRLIDI